MTLLGRLVLAAAIAIVVAIGLARAHGEADWIAGDHAYKDLNGTHCCGIKDCEPIAAESATYTRDGWTFQTDAGPFFFKHDAKNLYQTADRRGGRPFICWINANYHPSGVRCAFWAPGSS